MRSAETSNLGLVDWPGRSAVPAMTMHMQEAAANSEAAQHGSQSVLPASSDDLARRGRHRWRQCLLHPTRPQTWHCRARGTVWAVQASRWHTPGRMPRRPTPVTQPRHMLKAGTRTDRMMAPGSGSDAAEGVRPVQHQHADIRVGSLCSGQARQGCSSLQYAGPNSAVQAAVCSCCHWATGKLAHRDQLRPYRKASAANQCCTCRTHSCVRSRQRPQAATLLRQAAHACSCPCRGSAAKP